MASAMNDAQIAMLEPEVAERTTVPFGALATDEGRAALRDVLANSGFAVVSGVVDAAELATAEALFEADLTSVVDEAASSDKAKLAALLGKGISRRWPSELVMGTKPGMLSDMGMPHGQLAWYVRRHPNVSAVYAALHDTTELCVGTDNVFYTPEPVEAGSNAAAKSPLWPHADQNQHMQPEGGYDVYQGVAYIWAADADSNATVVWPGSNVSEYPKMFSPGGNHDERFGAPQIRSHFCAMRKQDYGRFAEHARRVPVPAGGLLLWSSRTIHQGWGRGRRLAVPVCMEPKARRSARVLRGKEQCVRKGRPTTHWAALGIPHGHGGSEEGDPTKTGIALRHAAHQHCVADDGAVAAAIRDLL
jgi:ectoine hydroxylase-related dioxygenase (phytanoyl-CoA dioxygenase family)